MRGGVSISFYLHSFFLLSSPHAWGCFSRGRGVPRHRCVFPTCVGVFPRTPCASGADTSLPHMRGGVSEVPRLIPLFTESSPHAWGCFLKPTTKEIICLVFPTCVGVFPGSFTMSSPAPGLPHMRGGVSVVEQMACSRVMSSPHAWGCFQGQRDNHRVREVFPTCVGVFPSTSPVLWEAFRLPHMRGGVSSSRALLIPSSWSSPHAWGCFSRHSLFQERGEVFPPTRGGLWKAG